MDNKLTEFLKTLSDEGKSKISIKNYKADIKSFLDWKQKSHPELSIFKAFKSYRFYLEGKYAESSIARKVSSISGFLRYSFPYELQTEKREKNIKRNLVVISTLSIVISIFLVIIFYENYKTSKDIKSNGSLVLKGDMDVAESKNHELEDKEDIQVFVSAPQIEEQSDKYKLTASLVEAEEKDLSFVGGRSTIKNGENEVKIISPLIKEDSFVYITPYSSGSELYIKEQANGYLIIANGRNNNQKTEFRWMLKESENSSFIF